ncbi:hypothetical protein KZO01_21210 [Kurthia zopfii]|uniref:Gas vesicle protein n=1 Tax=Kurthia zopfii TaxID=1650 RepID=A0A8B4QC55_9BACL|nr:YtxH domain-containing protein [Kurthia zopfii]PWI21921.1 YtxH domain-containing protein [Kurthia zopfii]TDR36294.1 gas vesicle protein [Kurthia zopfii]GEK31812.1 hypothetical protein KZO01_21210 [Kurthia zopfii]STX10331.1 Gas vesicle protein [Kurthia zopfii]
MNDSKLNYNDVRDELANTGHTVYLPEAYVSRQEALYEKESSGGKEFVIGAIVGGLVGAAAALFLAPKTGKDLRNDVIIQANTLKEKSSGITSQVKEKSSELASQAKEKSAQLSKKVQEQAGPVVDRMKSLKGNVQPPLDDGTAYSDDEGSIELMQTVENTIAEVEAEENKKA